MKMNKSRLLLLVSIAGFFVMSASFLLMPINAGKPGATLAKIVVGSLFWLGLSAGVVSQILLTKELKGTLAAMKRSPRRKRGIGLITFLSNRYAAAADAVMVLSLILLILSLFLSRAFGYFCYIIWFVFLFSFSMHCVLNGKNYYSMKLIEKRSVKYEENG